ncbi:MAG: hypothetical protein IKW71_03260 [Elusimicrobiaceae bacterium]|nr:hypothetical protein [Elusimicrobiaceae bacterium]
MKRVKWALLVCLLGVPALHALDVSYGKFLKITGIERTAGQVVLPVERKKYYNVRILDKSTYQFLTTCVPPCIQQVAKVAVVVQDVRPAQTRPDMWIVTVALNQDWLVTFLVFEKSGTYNVKSPKNLLFLQDVFKKEVEQTVVSAVKQASV